jgi:hypothetical protein
MLKPQTSSDVREPTRCDARRALALLVDRLRRTHIIRAVLPSVSLRIRHICINISGDALASSRGKEDAEEEEGEERILDCVKIGWRYDAGGGGSCHHLLSSHPETETQKNGLGVQTKTPTCSLDQCSCSWL